MFSYVCPSKQGQTDKTLLSFPKFNEYIIYNTPFMPYILNGIIVVLFGVTTSNVMSFV